MSHLENLKSMSPQAIKALVYLLNSDGIVTDSGESLLSSAMVKFWSEDYDEFLLEHGYTGEKIKTYTEFFEGFGAIYSVFDTSSWTTEKASKYLKKIRNQSS